MCKRFIDAFGPIGGILFAEGLSFKQAQARAVAERSAALIAEREALLAKTEKLRHRLWQCGLSELPDVAVAIKTAEPAAKQPRPSSGLSPAVKAFASSIKMPGRFDQ